jgi:WD40 repeat protein
MIQRRQFLGSLAVFCASSAPLSRLSLAATGPDKLNWHCDVIETVPHNRDLRSPVVTDVSLQSTGDLLAIVGDDHIVCIYDTKQKKFTEHLDRHTDWIRTARFSPNGSQLATAGNDRTLLIWKSNDWRYPAITERNPQAIFDVAFSNDGRKLATVGFESTLRIFWVGEHIIRQ